MDCALLNIVILNTELEVRQYFAPPEPAEPTEPIETPAEPLEPTEPPAEPLELAEPPAEPVSNKRRHEEPVVEHESLPNRPAGVTWREMVQNPADHIPTAYGRTSSLGRCPPGTPPLAQHKCGPITYQWGISIAPRLQEMFRHDLLEKMYTWPHAFPGTSDGVVGLTTRELECGCHRLEFFVECPVSVTQASDVFREDIEGVRIETKQFTYVAMCFPGPGGQGEAIVSSLMY